MGLRITQNILLSRAIHDITLNSLRLNGFRKQLSTGFRVNVPSDDPTAFLRILPAKNSIRTVQGLQQNSLLARDVLNTASSALEDAVGVMSEAKKLAVEGANGSLNDADRKTLASSINQLLREMVSLGNSRLGDRFLFSGTETSVSPFTLTDDSTGSFVTYAGDDRQVQVEVAPGASISIGLSGRTIFMGGNRTTTTLTGATGAATGTGTDSGRGMATLTLEHTGFSGLPAGISAGAGSTTALGNLSYTITSGPNTISVGGGPAVAFTGADTDLAVTTSTGDVVHLDMSAYAGGAASGTLQSKARMSFDGGQSWTVVDYASSNQQLTNTQTGHVLNIDSTGIVRVGSEQVSFGGTYDAFNVLVALRDLLQNKEGHPPIDVTQRITALIGEVDSVADQLLEGLRDVGASSSQLDLTRSRMSRLELTLEESLSRDRDIDIAETILKMTQRETAYQSSLAVGARVITTSLLDFLG